MGSRRRKKQRRREPQAQPAAKRKWLPAVAALVGVGIVAVVILFNLPGCESETATGPGQPTPLSRRSATDSETASMAATPTSEPAARTAETATVAPPSANKTANRPATASDARPGFEVLHGKWRRPDGGYVVEVKSVDAGGRMDASYSNPRPIHVSKAEASRDGAAIKVFIELRDVNYPGSTYDLKYDPGSDQLQGIYYQAALQQQFEVSFERVK